MSVKICKREVIYYFCCLAIFTLLNDEKEVIVSLPDGLIKGKLMKSIVTNSETRFYGFLGVRYAQPPLGKYRFLATTKVAPWEGIYDATYEKHKCYQVGIEDELQSEDCLFLNIFTPKLPKDTFENELLPVLFHIHGGGFIQGSGLISEGFGPDLFIDYDVIFVSINYRLGPFGFFSTGDQFIPGNAGLKDQNLALKWVNKNIKYFGGDPDKVTLLGESAGAASSSYHILSPQSAGLFRAAILQSGSSLNPWAYQRNQTNITYATIGLFSSSFIATDVDSTQLLDYLTSVDGHAIHKASGEYFSGVTSHIIWQVQQGFYYAPVLEPEGHDAFITKSMYGLFERGEYTKVPVILGVNSEESMALFDENFYLIQEALDSNIKLSVPDDMHLCDENKTIVGQIIKDKYVGRHTAWSDNLIGSIQYFSDQCNVRGLLKQSDLQSRYSNIYLYMFSYYGSMGGNTKSVAGLKSIGHGDELPYLYPKNINGINTANQEAFSNEDLKIRHKILSLWTNFAKYLTPTSDQNNLIDVVWPKLNLTPDGPGFQYLDIAQNLAVKVNPMEGKYEFWQQLYEKWAVLPYDTY